MADPFVAEIRIFPFNFAPKGWAWCDGQLMPLSQNTALFSLLGTTYGGDGRATLRFPIFKGALQCTRDRVPVSRCTISARRAAAKPSLCWSPRFHHIATPYKFRHSKRSRTSPSVKMLPLETASACCLPPLLISGQCATRRSHPLAAISRTTICSRI
jgi:microcystin-dependent protein